MDPIYKATAEEVQEYERLVAGLPPTSIGLGPHSMEVIRGILKIVKPKSILEIGFDRGCSAAMWLGLSTASLTSVDISEDPDLRKAVDVLQKRYPGRLQFKTLRAEITGIIDLAFIDGDHTEEGAYADLQLAKALKIPWVALDDWLPRFGPGVQAAAARAGFVPTSIFKQNIALGRFS